MRYLKETKYKGLILQPGNQMLKCFVDVDFMGNWDPIDTEDLATTRSRIHHQICSLPGDMGI